MSAALIQVCNRCKKPFVKLSGCNKMTCSCGNLQCYVCGQNIKDYTHFDGPKGDGKACPLHENNDMRLQIKIQEAQKEAVKKVMEEGEGLDEEDVKVDLLEAVPQPIPPAVPFLNVPPNFLPWNWQPPAGPAFMLPWGLVHIRLVTGSDSRTANLLFLLIHLQFFHHILSLNKFPISLLRPRLDEPVFVILSFPLLPLLSHHHHRNHCGKLLIIHNINADEDNILLYIPGEALAVSINCIVAIVIAIFFC